MGGASLKPAVGVEATGRRAYAILALAGANLTLAQYALMKELPALVGSNELAVLIVLVGYFLGLSVGYLVSDWPGRGTLLAIGVGTIVIHATFPFAPRYAAALCARLNLGGNILPGAFLLVLLGIAPFYAIFLPRLTSGAGQGGEGSLVRLYAIEVAGGLLGLLVVLALTPARMDLIIAAHLAGIVALLALLAPERAHLLAPLAVLPLLYVAQFEDWSTRSLACLYKHAHGYKEVRILASEVSPYQRVDVIEVPDGNATTRYLYLDGNLFYGNKFLNRHNLMVTMMPNLVVAQVSSGTNAAVLGAGSLDSVRYTAPHVGNLTVVELDGTVPKLTRKFIQAERGELPKNWDLVEDDGKHFLGSRPERSFDVISVDIPVPSHVQTAMLHSERFFRLARTRLKEGGIFSISLSGPLDAINESDPDDFPATHLAQRVMAGLYEAFPYVTVVESQGYHFAWATERPLGVEAPALNAILGAFLETTSTREHFLIREPPSIMADAVARSRASGSRPIGEADMQCVLRLSVSKLYYKYYVPRRG